MHILEYIVLTLLINTSYIAVPTGFTPRQEISMSWRHLTSVVPVVVQIVGELKSSHPKQPPCRYIRP